MPEHPALFRLLYILIWLAVFIPTAFAADEQKPSAPPATTSKPYIPPSPQNPTPLIRTATGGTRGENKLFPTVTLLVPEHVGYTLLEQPTVYWHISTAAKQSAVLTLSVHDRTNPLLEYRLPAPVPAGVHSLDFTQHGIRLQPDKIYEWSVSINENAGEASSGDLVAKGFIQRIQADPDLTATELEQDPLERARVYAGAGIWYDALAILSQPHPDPSVQSRMRNRRREMLEQVNIKLDTE